MKKRAAAALALFILGFGAMCMRLYYLSVRADVSAYVQSHYQKITLDYLRLPVLDCRGEKICGGETESYLALKPDFDSLPLLREILTKDGLSAAAERIAKGQPVCVKVGNDMTADGENAVILKKYVRYPENSVLSHLTGYVNSDGNGVSGIEESFNEYLKTDIPLYAGFPCSALGRVMNGAAIETEPLYNSALGGVMLTVDRRIQSAAEEALRSSDIKKGAVLVTGTKTGAIRAIASVPDYDRNNVGQSLEDAGSPLINRALSAYPAGSVFKTLTAAAALESGVSPNFTVKCTGSVTVDGEVFHCNNGTSHGTVDMRKALSVSCNCYFIALAQKTGFAPLLETAGVLGFGEECEIAKGISSAKGSLPDARSLQSSGQLALLSFGQGELTATAVQIGNLFSAIGNRGEYTESYAVQSAADAYGRTVYEFTPRAPVHAFSAETADTLRQMLVSVVNEGTAKNAKTVRFESAGKTATAQTGFFNADGTEKLCTWFAGFFPADDPEYTVVVLKEDGTTGGGDCAPVYKKIAERIFALTE